MNSINKFYSLLLLLTISFYANAQTGPGGIGTKDGTSNLVLWLDANTINQSNGTNVSTWTDQSGYGNTATASSGHEPTFQTSILNGAPVVRFTAANTDYLTVSDDASLKPADISVIVVASHTSSHVDWAPFVIKTDTWAWETGYGIATDKPISNQRCFVTEWDVNFVTDALAYNTPTIMTMVYDKSSVVLYNNEDLLGSDSYTADILQTTDPLLIGISPNNDGSGVQAALDGDIAEVIIVDRDITSVERIIIHNYLAAKYGLTLASNDKYAGDQSANGNYDFEVIGIGTESDGSQTESHGSGGLWIKQASNFGNGDYLMIGHNEVQPQLYTSTEDPGLSSASIEKRWGRDWYFDITDAGAAITVDLTFDFDEAGMNSSSSPAGTASNYKLLYRSGTSGNWSIVTSASSIGSSQVLFTGVSLTNGDGYYALGTIDATNSPLPIELLSFEARLNGNLVQIDWQTASETNNDYFTIERSTDGVEWQEIAQIPGAGNSNEIRKYSYIDNAPVAGLTYYRLKQTDYNGSFDYSPVRKVEVQQKAELKLYPNPTQNSITIEGNIQDEQNVRVYNSLGQEFSSIILIKRTNSTSIKIDLSALPKGVYFVRIDENLFKVFKN